MTSIGIEDFIVNFGFPLVATLIGAFFGFVLAILWQQKTERVKKKILTKETYTSIIDELKQIQDYVKKSEKELSFKWNPTAKEFQGMYATGSFVSFNIALNSGNLILLRVDLQHRLSTLFVDMEKYLFFMDETQRFPRSSIMLSDRVNIEANRLVNYSKSIFRQFMKGVDELLPILIEERNKL